MDYETVRALFQYDPLTGIVSNARDRHCARRGERAGTDHGDGYRRVSVKGNRILEHRLIFLWMTGRLPKEIDHINGNSGDNRWCNLREATRSQNCANTRAKKNKVKGVYQYRDKRRWVAVVRDGSKNKHLGIFDTHDEARAAYVTAGRKIYGEFFKGA